MQSGTYGLSGSLSDSERLARLETLATLMDAALVIPGTNVRVGFDALIGLVPGIGDVASAAISCFIIVEARRLGAPRWLLARMAGNVAVDAVGGVIPLVGDLFDVAFRANLKNVRLLRRHLERRGRA
ncbi:MAG TPA: DUF4112 domain-containing protein [Xanthobacteraceae bacterium]|nr:DUF4112 domain-containing protein [Xanthobacteraceae bacterium]